MSDPTEALRAVIGALPDPVKGVDLATGGRIQLARVKNAEARILLEADDLDTEQRAGLERKIRSALLSLPDVLSNRIDWTVSKRARTIIAVGSGKGGVGKSTLSANLAIAIARSGYKVGLVDADIYGPSQTRIMGRHDRPELRGEQIVPVEAHGVKMLSIGQLIEPNTAVAWRGPMTASALGNLMDGDWGDTELLVVDLPPGTGDIQMTLIQKWKPAGAVIISTPQDLALMDATRAIDMFRKMDVGVLGLIENMSGYQCPHCGESSDPFGSGGAEAAARVIGIPFFGRVPLTMNIRASSDAGQPLAAGDGYESKIFRTIAEKVMDALPGPKKSPVF